MWIAATRRSPPGHSAPAIQRPAEMPSRTIYGLMPISAKLRRESTANPLTRLTPYLPPGSGKTRHTSRVCRVFDNAPIRVGPTRRDRKNGAHGPLVPREGRCVVASSTHPTRLRPGTGAGAPLIPGTAAESRAARTGSAPRMVEASRGETHSMSNTRLDPSSVIRKWLSTSRPSKT